MNTELKIEKTVAPGETVAGVQQLCPFSFWQGSQRTQVCDRQAFEQVVADWQGGGAQAAHGWPCRQRLG